MLYTTILYTYVQDLQINISSKYGVLAENTSMKKLALVFTLCISFIGLGFAQDLTITAEDLRLESVYAEGGKDVIGYNLFIRKKPDINSVMLTETTQDEIGEVTNYAYRARSWNPVNGDETRMLDGKPLTSEYGKYSIIDSTPEADTKFGEAFCLFIPLEMEYGYPWSRHEIVEVQEGTYINIRSFGALYGDYVEGFKDNPFQIALAPKPPVKKEIPEEVASKVARDFNQKAVSNFYTLAEETDGLFVVSEGSSSVTDDIISVVNELDPSKTAKIVFAIDTTGSMKDDMTALQEKLVPALREATKDFIFLEVGLLLYRDYVDDYEYDGLPIKINPFTEDLDVFEDELMQVSIVGNEGGDTPEAVYEAIYGALEYYDWGQVEQKRIILTGDAEPHEEPRGDKKITRDMVVETAVARDVHVDAIIIPTKR